MLSFSQEVKCVWKRKRSTVTVLYIFIRYGTVIDMFLRVFDSFYVFDTIPVSASIFITTLVNSKSSLGVTPRT